MRFWPRSIRWQMICAVVLLEALSIGSFALLLAHQQMQGTRRRAEQRLTFEVSSMALQAREALIHEKPGWVELSVTMVGANPAVARAKVTDVAGNVLFASPGELEENTLTAEELAQIPRVRRDDPLIFVFGGNRWEGVKAIYTGGDLRGYAWVEYNKAWAAEQMQMLLRGTVIFACAWILSSIILVLLLYTSIMQPLRRLYRATHALMLAPERAEGFPLQPGVQNEVGELISAFNGMVASLDEQRAGLNETLSMLDSMLAHAPIGLAFFDRDYRFVRVNQVFAGMTGVPLSRHLGRKMQELLPREAAQPLGEAVRQVFLQQDAVRNLELSGTEGVPWTWLVSAYPVSTRPEQVRLAGVIILDATERKRTEDALRRAEKLAVTGRLAASIAHEINNPLEAVTNLLFLLDNYCQLDEMAKNYVGMAAYEVRRVAEITQQTLRFYRQSTLPGRVRLAELLDSVLSLYQGRLNALNLDAERRYDPAVELDCFAGEIRQVVANLIGNAIDACSSGGRIQVRARRSVSWRAPERAGVRFTVADNGSGMEADQREHAFEAFYTTKEETGTGLGLWISQTIIEKHRGEIRLRSRMAKGGRSHGTVFQFFIPDLPATENAKTDSGLKEADRPKA